MSGQNQDDGLPLPSVFDLMEGGGQLPDRTPPGSVPEAREPLQKVSEQVAPEPVIEADQVPVRGRKKLRAPTAEEVSMAARIGRRSMEGAQLGSQLGRRIPRVGPVLGGAGGAVIGLGQGVAGEAERITEERRAAREIGGRVTGEPGRLSEEQLAARRVPSSEFSSQAGLASFRTPTEVNVSVPSPGQPGSPFNPVVRERPRQEKQVPVSERPYPYKFVDQPPAADGPEYDY